MAEASKAAIKDGDENVKEPTVPNCLGIAEHGIRTAQHFAQFMSAMMGDVISGRLSTSKAVTATGAGRAMLHAIEMQYRYGSENEQPGKKSLRLID